MATKFDRYAQSPEAMSEFMSRVIVDCGLCPIRQFCKDNGLDQCESTWLAWLKTPVRPWTDGELD